MQQFIEKYREQIYGSLTGFDRLVFRGSLRQLNFVKPNGGALVAAGMENYLWQNKILFKDYQDHVKSVSERIKKASLAPFEKQELPVVWLSSPTEDKSEVARRIAEERKMTSGLVCAISAMEPSPTFEHRKTHIIRRTRPCHVLYHYQIHPELGWMHARIQTWFPFNIQVALNGREWLAKLLDAEGLKYLQQGNCFLWLEDYARAQELMNRQVERNWEELLNGFARQLNPEHERIFQQYPVSYYWTCDQSEWTTDVIFREQSDLKRLMPLLVRHGMLSYCSADVMRYFGKRVNLSGEIPAQFGGTLKTDFKRRQSGERVKFSLNSNSVKYYDKAYSEIGSVLRAAETTLIQVGDFRAYRSKEGGDPKDLQWRPMRKGIADLHRRTEVSQKANERVMNALASVDDSRRVEELTAGVQKRTTWNGRRVRALRPWGDDKELLTAINHGEFTINGLRNRNVQDLLYGSPSDSPQEQKRRSSAISRKLRMLRAHGIIQKVPHTHRYQVTDAGRAILLAVLTTARTSLNQLNQLPKVA